ncbi:MAG: ribonuclease Z [Candidatus Thorarchaeota archaeon]|jgi:ribonuclease Z
MEIVILGSGGSIPTEGRNHPAIVLRHGGWNLMFDCGEDTQRQFERAGLGQNKKMAIFITHTHADHLLGLGGLLLRFSLLGRIKPLDIYGPVELIEYVKVNQQTINLGTTFKTTVYGIKSGTLFEMDNLAVRAFEVDHRGLAFGYEVSHHRPTGEFLPDKAKSLGVPKGPLWGRLSNGETVRLDDGREIRPEEVTGPRPDPLKIVYTGDTRPCDSLREAAKDADVLISEAMYASEHSDLAEERGHMTASSAATLANESNVRLLVLTHYSPRYEDGGPILEEARGIFPDAVLAEDFMRITLNLDGTTKVLRPDHSI